MKKLSKDRGEMLKNFSELKNSIVENSSLSEKMQSIILLSLAVSSQCDLCISFYVKEAKENGASRDEIIDGAMLSIVMGGGPKLMYMNLLYDELDEVF